MELLLEFVISWHTPYVSSYGLYQQCLHMEYRQVVLYAACYYIPALWVMEVMQQQAYYIGK